MAAIWVWFAVRHVAAFKSTGNVAYLMFCFSETITAGFFVIRRPPVSVSQSSADWLLAVTGTFTPLFVQPTPFTAMPYADIVLVVGVILQILSMLSLNRSFGLVAARREIKTRGMYSIVRHPLYASYLFILTGYALSNASPGNLILILITISCLVGRILREERYLVADALYRQYVQRVRYRLLPPVF